MNATFLDHCTGSRVIYASAQRHDFPKMFAVLYGHKAPAPMRALIFEGVMMIVISLLRLKAMPTHDSAVDEDDESFRQ